jgi:succinate dehydrogenase flavin-adding protein (antitoxin of CptAB toxin-antitoxin module)
MRENDAMDYSIRQFAGFMVGKLDELQNGMEFAHLLNCSESDLREEALRLHEELNDLKARLASI